MYIEKIQSPADLKGMDIATLNIVADEVRQAVLNRVSKHGGHVGPNLGFVEATVTATRFVFVTKKDTVIYDMDALGATKGDIASPRAQVLLL